MNDFESIYKSAMQDVKEYHIDVTLCMDEHRHKNRIFRQVYRKTATVFSVVCVVLICGLGSVTAADYIQNIIKVNSQGFESADTATMNSNKGVSGTYVIDEAVGQEVAVPEAAVPETAMSEAAVPEAAVPEAAAPEMALAGQMSVDSAQADEIPVHTYASWEEFEKNEDIIFPQPSISIGETIASTEVTVSGSWAMVRYDVDGKVFWMERTDYGDTNGHVSSKVFPGGVGNERAYMAPMGYEYTLVDSVKVEETEQLQIHAATTVGSYEVYMDFMGFIEEDVMKIIDSVDISQYE